MRKIIVLLFGLSVISGGIGFVLKNSYKNGLCFADLNTNTFDVSCHILWNSIGSPLFYGALALAVVFGILFIFPYTFKAWQNFALWFLPPALYVFATYTGPGRGYIDVTPYPVTMYKWLGGFYVIVSLAIIAFSFLNKKYGREKPQKTPSQRQKIVFWSLWALYVAFIIVKCLFYYFW